MKNESLHCDCDIIHHEVVEKVSKKILDETVIYDIADLFKVFGDSTRAKLINALFEAEMCVCDLSNLLDMKQSAISHQLRVLKQSKLVKYRKEGRVVYYSLKDKHIYEIFKIAVAHVGE